MNKHEVSIATLTWARNKEEETILREALSQLAKLGLPVFITDAGSDEAFLDFLLSFPHFTLAENIKGVWPQAKNSLQAAYRSGSKFIFYTEPDKTVFFAEALPAMLDVITVSEQTGVIMAARSSKGFSSFPSFQQMTETTINNCCAELTGKQVDHTYGPFLLNRKLVPQLEALPQDIGWGWRPYCFGLAHRLGYGLDAFAGDFCCPPEQRDDTPKERIYRMAQLSQNIQGLVLSASAKL